MVSRYPKEMEDFVREHLDGLTNRQLAELTNERFGTDLNASKMKSYIGNHGLSRKIRGSDPEPYYKLPKEHREFILENYKGTGYREMIEKLRNKFGAEYTFNQIKGFYGRNHLDSGLTGYKFTKETCPHPPKGTHFYPPSEFKKGHRPVNWKPVGSERTNTDGSRMIKVAEPNVWRLKARVVWEEANGPIPPNHVIVHLDGNAENCELGNLEILSRSALVRANQKHLLHSDPDLTATGIALAKLRAKAFEVKKQRKQKRKGEPTQ